MSFLESPLWLVFLPLAMAPVVYVVRRRSGLPSLIAAATALVTARICVSTPFDWSLSVLGREMSLRPGDRLFLACAFLLAALYFVYAWALSQGWSFFPFVLVVLALFAASTMIENTIVAVLLLEIAATVAVLIIQAGRQGSVKGGVHYLSATAMAIPPLLVAAHLFEVRILNPDDATLPKISGFLLVLGFGLLLGVAPFQSWLFMVSSEAPPMVSAFLFSVGSGVVVFKLLEVLHRFPWLVSSGEVLRLTFVVGLGSLLLGGLFGPFQGDFARLFGWAVLADTGFLFVALSPGSSDGLAVSALLLVSRWISVSLIAMGMGVLRRECECDDFAAMSGALWRKPAAVVGLTVGGLSLAGFPLTGGFAARWLALQNSGGQIQAWSVPILVAGLAVSFGYLRGLSHTAGRSQMRSNEPEPAVVRILIGLLVLLTLLLALYPQFALDPLSKVMSTLVSSQ